MTLEAFAERVLFEPSLEAKLAPPPAGRLEQRAGAPAARDVDRPARPPGLQLPPPGPAPRATARDLDAPESRGAILHAFANHELLALELMAAMLLRFPDAPAGWRRGLVAVMRDEQRHMRLYLNRMRALGVTFGSRPLSGFFWHTLRDSPSPESFNAAMALTLEQANLDHAVAWRARFEAVGDEASAALMAQVLDDEVRHVAHGVRWAERWSPQGTSLWDAYTGALVFPMTPARAKGAEVHRAPRRRAGLPEDFIDAVARHHESRGRVPDVHTFDPTFERQLTGAHGPLPNAARVVVADLETSRALDAATDDVVAVTRLPSGRWLDRWRAAGLPAVQWLEVDAPTDEAVARGMARRPYRTVVPWGPRTPDDAARTQAAAWASKATAAAWSRDHWEACTPEDRAALEAPDETRVAYSLGEALATLEGLLSRFEAAAVKAPVGTAGRGVKRVQALESAPTRWLARVTAEQGAVIVQPWHDVWAELSVQGSVGQDGAVSTQPPRRFFTDARGGYRGAWLGRPDDGWRPSLRRFWHGDGTEPGRGERLLREAASFVGRRLAEGGFEGPFGVDALGIHRQDGSPALVALSEVNPRRTMGRLAEALGRRVRRGAAAAWLHVPRVMAPEGFEALHEALESRLPFEVAASGVRRGVVGTGDPLEARRVWPVAVVAPSHDALDEALRAVGLPTTRP